LSIQNHFNSHKIKSGALHTAPNNTAYMNVHCCWESCKWQRSGHI